MKHALTLTLKDLEQQFDIAILLQKFHFCQNVSEHILRNKWNHNGIEIVAKGYIKLQTLFFFRHPNSLLAINHTMIFIIWLIVVHCKFRYFLLQLKFYCRLIKYCFYQSELHLLVLSRSQRITRKTVFLHWITGI